MKTTKKLTLGIFIAMSGLIGAGTAQAGPTYVLSNQPLSGCKDIGSEGGLHKYRCMGIEVNTEKFVDILVSSGVNTASGYQKCSFRVDTWATGIFYTNWHHKVTAKNLSRECSTDVSISDNTFYAIVNLKAAAPPSHELGGGTVGGGLPDPSTY